MHNHTGYACDVYCPAVPELVKRVFLGIEPEVKEDLHTKFKRLGLKCWCRECNVKQ